MSKGVVLLVDDDENILRFVSMALRQSGYEVVTATGANETLELSRQRVFHAMVLDNGLPEMSGIEVLQRIRKAHPQMAAVLSSGRISPAVVSEARRLGVTALEEPYRVAVLVQALEDAMLTRT